MSTVPEDFTAASSPWDRFVDVLVSVWHWANDWYSLVVIGAALIGVVVVIIEIKQLKGSRT